jgi:hypothetical protein
MANLAVLGSFKINGVAEVCHASFRVFCDNILNDLRWLLVLLLFSFIVSSFR